MEADIDSGVDARAIAETGAKAAQLHTGGMCHLDAEMTRQGLAELGIQGSRFGDSGKRRQPCLPCRVRHRRGEERDDFVGQVRQPLKYPLMFQVCDVVLVNKIDVLPYSDFDMDKCREYVALPQPERKGHPDLRPDGRGH